MVSGFMDETADESIRSYGDFAPAYCGRDSDLLYSDTLAQGLQDCLLYTSDAADD